MRNLMRLALPLTAGIILHALYSLVDVFWLGKLGEGGEAARAIAAPGVSFPFVWFTISFGMGFGTAGTAIVAQFTGAKRHREADGAAAQMFIALLSIVIAMGTPFVGTATAGAGGNCLFQVGNVNKEFRCPEGARSLYAALVHRAAYTPVAEEQFTVSLGILQD